MADISELHLVTGMDQLAAPTGSAQLITISFGSCPSMRLVLAPAHHDVGITADN
ncbi:hypothetical protein T12_16959 [Trichinella patagoniensis]|uniref:Uncharacterized protein n=1 Tax=Trichinella patagoniensis TaxID=990121 RepID=A0A0V1A448_9BILA|nr:hypothetical protein T12_16959 [Trichinella patagoniensis]